MAEFNQAGLPTGYAELLQSARQNLVKLPNGSYVQAPNRGQPTSLEEIYAGIIPSQAASSLASRKVSTVPVDSYGNPIQATAPTLASTLSSGVRPAITQGVQPSGTVQMPPGARPASVDRAFAQMGGGPVAGPSNPRGYNVLTGEYEAMQPATPYKAGADRDARFPVGTEMGYKPQDRLGAPALDAIDLLLGSGNSTMPRQAPLALMRSPVAARPSQAPSGSSYTIKKGDTLSSLAKRYNTTVNNLAMANGIRDPNKIRAGASLVIPGAPVPRSKPAGMLAAAPNPSSKQSRAARFTNLDRFGMIK